MKEIFVLKEGGRNNHIESPKDLFKQTKEIKIDHYQENCIIFYLDTRNNIIDYEILFKGGVSCCAIDPKNIFRNVLLKKASNIAIAHNHPSGNLEPSNEDVRIFKQLRKAGDILHITILDFLIFNEKEFYSVKCYERG
ncbi:DNA repair protein RadC [Limihaloglobus sulfuriphilus]|uniref:DNA repair protein RadC n=1 Tax=Limihaloglobus sulfuriphilus TaxID=1851148 RepID=A0A1Q2MFE9_9BACT|nr:JAB domain-containing protein [Limihaloglobus sulfuriphilus]AQQ71421.1 DNA repair protein RadC [Limihaloglobus sulfuriphilus]